MRPGRVIVPERKKLTTAEDSGVRRKNIVKLLSVILAVTFVTFATGGTAQAAQEKFSLDKNLTYVGFEVRYFLLIPITGRFNDFEGNFVIDREHPENNRADIVIKTTSIDTGKESRNEAIRGPALFDADKYPEMTFHSDKIEINPDNTGVITGALTLRGVTRPVTLELIRIPDVETQKTGKDNAFSDGFMVTGKIKRSDFGMNEYIVPIGNVVSLFVCYKLEKCDSTYMRRKETKYQYND